ncbi:hypothetical protein WJX73_008328 [Symbiochloris irregularis]|uniref:Uncharacterized protein n=1 Tax=Symbiochloris irregularis TaxID=706552 RepID=A0AAW1PDZ4_9CHLO
MIPQQASADQVGSSDHDKRVEALQRFTHHWINAQHDAVRPTGSESPSALNAVQVQHRVPQYSSPAGLLRSPNDAFNKLATVLFYLSHHLEVLTKEAERRFYPMLAMFGEAAEGKSSERPNALAAGLLLARSLASWRTLHSLVAALTAACLNLLEQLGALCATQTRKATIVQGEHAVAAFSALSKAVGVMATLDALIVDNARIKLAFTQLHQMLQSPSSDAGDLARQHQPTGSQSGEAISAVTQLQGVFVGRGVFRRFLDIHMGQGAQVADACSSPSFLSALSSIVKAQVAQVTERTDSRHPHLSDARGLLGWLALGVVHCHLCPEAKVLDRKLLRLLTRLHSQVPVIPVYLKTACQPTGFLSQYLPTSADAYLPARFTNQAAAMRGGQLEQMMLAYMAEQDGLVLTVVAWQARLAHVLTQHRSNDALLSQMVAAAVEGTRLQAALASSTRTVLAMHQLVGAKLPPPGLHALVRHLGLIKAIEATFRQHHFVLAEAWPHLLTHCKSTLQGALEAVIAALKARRRGAQAAALRRSTLTALDDACTAATAAVHIALGPVSAAHMAALAQCLDAMAATGVVPDSDRTRLEDLLRTLDMLAFHSPLACKAHGTCEILYFHRGLLQPALADLLAHPHAAARLPHVLAAFADACLLAPHAPQCAAALQQELHSWLVAAVEAQLPMSSLHIRSWIERHLSATFHEYTAGSPGDWQSYGLMAALAQEQYGLQVAAPALPPRMLDQGMDLADVTRRFSGFMAGVSYGAAPQVFLELPDSGPGSKHLHTLTPRHVVQALWTNGVGLADGAVQAALQGLTACMAALTQWLQQEGIAARLHKEAASIAQGEAAGAGGPEAQGPTAATHALAADLARLGPSPEGHTSHLQYLVSLLTRIGNALGFLRMVRTAQLEAASTDRQLLPGASPPSHTLAASLQAAAGLSPHTKAAAAALDRELQHHSQLPPSGPLYLKAVVSIFTARLASNSSSNDGFAFGTAFVLQVLQQDAAFQARQWFSSLQAHFADISRPAEEAGLGTFV